MNNYRKIRLLLSLSAAIICLGSCTKTGPDGPEGPQGEQGPVGSKGDPGPKGDAGQDGSAGVIHSDWLSVTFTNDGDAWVAVIDAPEITQDVLDKAEIEVYGKDNDDNIHELNFFMGDGEDSMGSGYLTQKLDVGKITLSGTFDASSFSFRYFIMPAGEHVRYAAPPPDVRDYQAVCRYYGITE